MRNYKKLSGNYSAPGERKDNPPRVFVTQEMNGNYETLTKFGEITFLTADEFAQRNHSLRNQKIMREIDETMLDYRPGVDYLAVSGSPVVVGLAFVVAARKGPTIKVLHWHKADKSYHQYDIDIDHIERPPMSDP